MTQEEEKSITIPISKNVSTYTQTKNGLSDLFLVVYGGSPERFPRKWAEFMEAVNALYTQHHEIH